MANMETRVARIAEATLADQRFVRRIDILVGLGWLAQPNVDRWERGRVDTLDRCVQVDTDTDTVAAALTALRRWAEDCGLKPSEVEYQELQFTTGGDPDAERAYRTHWASAELSEPVVPRPRRPRDIVVISAHRAWTCASCGETGDLLLKGKDGALCLDCADLGHLEFLPSGDAALTRRAKKASRWSAVVVRWSLRRKRYERQGILAEPAAIEQAAQQCLSDADVRARRRERERFIEATTTYASATSSPRRFASNSWVVRPCAPTRSRFTRQHAAAAASGEAPPGEHWNPRPSDSPSWHPSGMSTPTTTTSSWPAPSANRLAHKCEVVSRTPSTPGATARHHSTSLELGYPAVLHMVVDDERLERITKRVSEIALK
jgi:hypothetical protein